MIDVHYDEIEYLKFNNNIVEAMVNNYLISKSMINMDRKLFSLNSDLELRNHFLGNDSYIQWSVFGSYNRQCDSFSTTSEKLALAKKAKVYLRQRAPYDFYYIGKKNIDAAL